MSLAPLLPALRELTRDGTLVAGFIAYVVPFLAFRWLAGRLDQPPKETAGILLGGIMTVLIVPLWRRLAIKDGRCSVDGGILAAAAAWIGTFGIVWLVLIGGAAIHPNRLRPAATIGERLFDGTWFGLIIAGFTSIATFPAALALVLLAVWCRSRSIAPGGIA